MAYTAEKANDRINREGTDKILQDKIKMLFEEYKETYIYTFLGWNFFCAGKFNFVFKTGEGITLREPSKNYTDIIRRWKSGKFYDLCRTLDSLTEGNGFGAVFFRDCVMPKIQSNEINFIQMYEIMLSRFFIKPDKGEGGYSIYFLEAILETFGNLDSIKSSSFSSGNEYQDAKNVLSEAFDKAIKKYKQDRPNVVIDPFEVKGTLVKKPNVKKMKTNVKNVFPSSFLNQKMPLVPYVQVEFKTQLDQENMLYDDPRLWQSITYNPNSHFISMELDDNKGIKRLTLNLFDKTYTELENIIAKTILITNLKLSPDKEIEASSGGLTFVFAKTAFTNLRIRFGYQTKNLDDNLYKDRVKNADVPVYKTEWLYFQMLGFKQEATDAGMNFLINAISSGGNSFNNIKILKKFAVIKGTPSKIISTFTSVLNDTFKKASYTEENQPIRIMPFKKLDTTKTNTSINIEDESLSQNPWDLRLIEVPLGEKPKLDKTGNVINEYKTFKEVLDDLCAKVSPLYLDSDGNVKQIMEGQEKEDMRVMNFTYSITEVTIDIKDKNNNISKGKQNRIRFFYSNPDKMLEKDTVKVRNYYWKNYGATVVKSLNISTETDFAQMNMPLLTYSPSGDSVIQSVSYAHVEKDKDGNILETKKEFKDEFLRMDVAGEKELYQNHFKLAIQKALKTDDFTFSARAIMPSISGFATPQKIAEMYMYQYAVNVNSSIFRGNIELLGDPFFLFDDALAPYSYLIRIVVLRPSEYKIEYNENEPAKNQKAMSYLSGFYVISNIKHNISDSGYTTTLEVMKWPTAYEIPFDKDPEKEAGESL